MSLSNPIPLPLDAGVNTTEIGGFALCPPPPDRFTDHVGVDLPRTMILQWLDNKEKKSKEVYINLGTTGNLGFIRVRHSMGTFRSRQYIIKFTDACLFELVSMEDDNRVLR